MAFQSGMEAFFKCPYQAKVMKMLENKSNVTVLSMRFFNLKLSFKIKDYYFEKSDPLLNQFLFQCSLAWFWKLP